MVGLTLPASTGLPGPEEVSLSLLKLGVRVTRFDTCVGDNRDLGEAGSFALVSLKRNECSVQIMLTTYS